jgi:hypothetical protein
MYIPQKKGTKEPTYHLEYQEVDIANYGLKKWIGLTPQAIPNEEIT